MCILCKPALYLNPKCQLNICVLRTGLPRCLASNQLVLCSQQLQQQAKFVADIATQTLISAGTISSPAHLMNLLLAMKPLRSTSGHMQEPSEPGALRTTSPADKVIDQCL